VGDFGVAREGDDFRNQDTLATQTGAMIGTLAYMSPEQIRGEKLDQRSDIYSLGAILYECLAERRAFVADAPHSLIYKILHEHPEPLASLRPDLPEAVAKLVERAMAREREARFERVDDLARALKAIVPAATSPAEATELDPSRSQLHAPRARRRSFELAVIALAGAAVGAVATSASLRGSTENGDTAAASAATERSDAVVADSVEQDAALAAVSSAEPARESPQEPAISTRPATTAVSARPRTALAPFVVPTKPSAEPAASARLNPDAAIDPFALRRK
jgi:serine/threonine protein kinase